MHFEILNNSSARALAAKAEELFGDEVREDVDDSFAAALGFAAVDGAEVAASIECGCLLFRVYEGSYAFTCPMPLCDGADIRGALLLLADYCRRELIRFLITDVDRDTLSIITDIFSHVDASAYDGEEDFFAVAVLTELDRMDSIPRLKSGEVTLREMLPFDKENYYRLSTSEVVNRYWGYDYREDAPSADADYFFSVAECERDAGAALTLTVLLGEEYVGEAVLFDFDFRKGASIGLRLLPEFWGHGIGGLALELLIDLARNMGLCQLFCQVDERNLRSLSLIGKYFRRGELIEGKQRFTLSLLG